MNKRYRDARIANLTKPEARFAVYREILTATATEREIREMIPQGTAREIAIAPLPHAMTVEAQEKVTRHDIAAFVDCFTQNVRDPQAAPYLYWGFTSSDLVDTSNAILMKDAWSHITKLAYGLVHATTGQETNPPRIGRTHGQRAYQVPTYDAHHRLAHHMTHLLDRRVPEFLGKLSGPTGQYNHPMTAEVEKAVLMKFGIGFDPCATQITSRVWYADVGFTCVQLISLCEQFALQIRLRAQDGIAELQEEFGRFQKGSSSMPHKRNPIVAERICGLARLARGLFSPLMETHGAMWDQRDISNSSVERVALWDLLELTAYVIGLTHSLVGSLLMWNDEEARTWVSSADQLNELIGEGYDRHTAYGQLRGDESRTEGVAQAAGDPAGSGDPARRSGSADY